MDIIVEDFLGLCDQKTPINMGPVLSCYGLMGVFSSRKRIHVSHAHTLYDIK